MYLPLAYYFDGFVLPIPRAGLEEYKKTAEKVTKTWKKYSTIEYFEYLGDDLFLEGTKSFIESLDAKEDETII